MADLSYQRVTIANGASVSAEIDLKSHLLVGIQVPPAWTTASITFDAAARPDNVEATNPTFDHVVDSSGAEVEVAAVVSTYVGLTTAHQDALRSLRRVKLRSGKTGAFVNQGGARIVTLILEPRD